MQPQLDDLEKVYLNFIRDGQMQSQMGIWKRFTRSLSGVNRCSLRWGSERGLLEIFLGMDRCSLSWGSGSG